MDRHSSRRIARTFSEVKIARVDRAHTVGGDRHHRRAVKAYNRTVRRAGKAEARAARERDA